MIRMILTDLDHTLLKQDGSVSGKTLQILTACRTKGIRFAIATARYWIGAERYIDLLNPDYEITTDGTLVHSHRTVLFQVSQKQLPEQRSQQPAEKPSIGTVIIFLNRKNSIRLYIAIIHLRWMYRQTKSWPNCRMNLLPGKLLCRQHPEKRQRSEPWLRSAESVRRIPLLSVMT